MIPEYRTAYLRRALGDRYELQGFLGKGAFASVYLVKNRKLERFEALKVLAESYDGDHQFAQRFVEEAKLIASLSHPNIVQVHDYGEVDGVLWYSMQFVDGPSLRKELSVRHRMSTGDVVNLAVPLLDALAYSHRRHIIHRDIKPGNILLDSSGRPFLMDFGIAKVKDSNLKTQTGSVMGTPAYIAPEQAAGEPLDSRCDIYSFGTTLYELLVGYSPFTSSDPLRTLLRRLKEEPAPPRASIPEIAEELERIVLKSLEREPGARYQSAEEMADDLRRCFPWALESGRFKVIAETRGAEPLPPSPKHEVDPSELRTVVTAPVVAADSSNVDPDESTVSTAGLENEKGGAPVERIPLPAAPTRRLPLPLIGVLSVIFLIVGIAALSGFLGSERPEPGTALPAASQEPRSEPEQTLAAGSPGASETAVPGTDRGSISPDEPPSSEGADTVSKVEDGEDPGLVEGVLDMPSGGENRSTVANSETKTTAPSSLDDEAADSLRSEAENATRQPAGDKTQPPPPAPQAPVYRRPVTFPKILQKVEPVLPVDTAPLCAGERVLIDVLVDETGRVKSTKVLESKRPECAAAAQEAAAEYEFSPARDFAGEPLEARTSISVGFERIAKEAEQR